MEMLETEQTSPVEEKLEPVRENPIDRLNRRYNKLASLYNKKVQKMKAKIEGQGWFYVPEGDVLPKLGEEILVVIDKRVSKEGDDARMVGKEPMIRVRHGFVYNLGYNNDVKEWFIETTVVRVPRGSALNKSGSYTNGHPDHIMFWKPLPKVPPLPKFVKEEFEFSQGE